MKDFFDNFKKENKEDLENLLINLCKKNGWFLTDQDWLGIIADGKYYCLGDPSDKIEKIIIAETTEHELVECEDDADEVFSSEGETFYVSI